MKNVRTLLTVFTMALCMLGLSYEAEASHYRYGSISYEHVSGRTYRITVKQGWRKSAFWNSNVGQTVYTGSLSTGDGNISMNLLVTSVNLAEDWFFAEGTFTKTFSRDGLFNLSWSSCCRIGGLSLYGLSSSMALNTQINVGSGNSSPVQTIPPIINLQTGQAAATFNVPAIDPDGQNITYSKKSGPSNMSVNPSTGQVTWNTQGLIIGSRHVIQIAASDGLTTVFSDFIVRIVKTSTPPAFDYAVTPSNGQVYQVSPGQNVSFNVKADDIDQGSTVTLSAVGTPGSASLSPSLPTTANSSASTSFSWTPGTSNLGVNVINFTAQDDNGVQTQTSVSILVSLKPQFDVPPTPANGVHTVIEPGTNYSFTAQASDPDPNDVVQIVSVTHKSKGGNFTDHTSATISSLPTAAGNPTSMSFSWTPAASEWGHNHAYITAEDSYGDQTVHEVAMLVNTTPAFSSSPVTSAFTNQAYSYSVTVVDPDVAFGDAISILPSSPLPAWLTLTDHGNGTATLSGTPGNGDAGVANIILQAEDLNHHMNVGGMPQQSFSINVIANQAPVASAKNITVAVGANCSASITPGDINDASSDPDGDPLTYSIDNAGPFGVGTYTVTLTADDGQATASDQATVTVVDNANPTAVSQDVTIALDANGQASIVTAGGSTVVFDGTFAGDGNGTTSGSLTNWNVTSGSVDVSAFISGSTQSIDLAGNSNGKIESASNISLAPGTYELSFVYKNNDGSPGTSNSFDVSLGSAFSKSYTSALYSGNVSVTESITVAANETATLSFEQTGSNDASGTFLADIVLNRITASGLMIENGSSDNCGIASLSASQVNFTCADLGANNVTLTATDIHGNTGSSVAVVTVVDNIDPVLHNIPQNITEVPQPNNCTPSVTWNAPTASDNCSATITSSHNSGDNFPVGPTTVTYTATDAAGNSVSGSFVVTVLPTPVVITGISSPSFIGGDNISCNGASDGSIDLSVDGGCEPYAYAWDNGASVEDPSGLSAGTYDVTVTDANGQTATGSITLTEPAPVVASASSSGYLSGNGVSGSTLYLGYGPQSINLNASAVGGHGAYSYSWDNGMTGANISVSPTATTSYTVTITDQNGCSDNETVTVNVQDVRCAPGKSPSSKGKGNKGRGNGRQMKKVNVCHNGNTICIDSSAVASHLANHNHGRKSCYLGACGASAKNGGAISSVAALDMHIYPNPTEGIFNVQIHSDVDADIQIVLSDVQGRVISLRNDQVVNGVTEAQFDLSDYANGVYIIKVIGLREQQVSRLIKN